MTMFMMGLSYPENRSLTTANTAVTAKNEENGSSTTMVTTAIARGRAAMWRLD
ncbi:MAG: hypothetical protein LBI87_07515 [Candidatus Accumulibacter sp.]|nr:hypothetical protein [Accumulibacter sp.]